MATHLGVPSDKLLHFVCALALMVATMTVFHGWLAIVMTGAVCVGKEVYDCFKEHHTGFSLEDLAADALGMIIALLIWIWI